MLSVVVEQQSATLESTKGRPAFLPLFSSSIPFLARGTYFCPRCQANRETMAPKKGSLLGWATTTAILPSWQCPACTLNNKGGSLACSACGSKAPTNTSVAASTSTGVSSWSCPACTLTNKAGNLTCSACGGPRLESQGKTENSLVGLQKGLKRKREDGGDQKSKMARVLVANQNIQTNDILEVNVNNQSIKEPPVLCSGHSKPCQVKTVSQFRFNFTTYHNMSGSHKFSKLSV